MVMHTFIHASYVVVVKEAVTDSDVGTANCPELDVKAWSSMLGLEVGTGNCSPSTSCRYSGVEFAEVSRS